MGASYRYTAIALLAALVISLLFVYALKPKEAAGAEVNSLPLDQQFSFSTEPAHAIFQELGEESLAPAAAIGCGGGQRPDRRERQREPPVGS